MYIYRKDTYKSLIKGTNIVICILHASMAVSLMKMFYVLALHVLVLHFLSRTGTKEFSPVLPHHNSYLRI